jgi:hypothetical protein
MCSLQHYVSPAFIVVNCNKIFLGWQICQLVQPIEYSIDWLHLHDQGSDDSLPSLSELHTHTGLELWSYDQQLQPCVV